MSERTINDVLINGEPRNVSDILDNMNDRQISLSREQFNTLSGTLDCRCFECGQKLFLRAGDERRACFYHPCGSSDCKLKTEKGTSKSNIYSGELSDHINVTGKLFRYFSSRYSKSGKVTSNKQIKTISEYNSSNRRPDIFVPDLNLAVEYQRAWLPIEDLILRNNYFKKNNVKILWIFSPQKNDNLSMKDYRFAANKRYQQTFSISEKQKAEIENNIVELTCTYHNINNEKIQTECLFEDLVFSEFTPVMPTNDNRADLIHHLMSANNTVDRDAAMFCRSIIKQIKQGKILTRKQKARTFFTLRDAGIKYTSLLN